MFTKPFSINKKREREIGDVLSHDSHDISDQSSLSPTNISSSDRDVSLRGESRVIESDSCVGQNVSLDNHSILHEYVAEEEAFGLKVLHRPENEPRADIIFIHGLGGSSRMTWSKNRDPNYFWPLKFLPLEDDINKARVLTYGYNATPKRDGGKTKKSMLDFAKDLLYDLKYAQAESPLGVKNLDIGKRPVIFVAHSMGGLIVKEAYLNGRYDPSYEEIIKSVFGIIFLATPHRGTDLAKALNRVLQASFVSNPKHFITELSTGSHTIQNINEQFRHIAPKLQIFSFYETQPTKILMKSRIMVLEKDSAILGYPGEVSRGLDADHHEVCKYDSPQDHRYISIRNALKSIIHAADQSWAKEYSSPISALKISDYLKISEKTSTDFDLLRGRWTPGTCRWILKNDSFSEWIKDIKCNSRVLWLQGRPASGKTVLSSYIIDHLIQLGLFCHHHFISFSNQKSRSGSMILRLLAYQIACSLPEYAKKICQYAEAITDFQTADFRTIWHWLYKQALFSLEKTNQTLYWVIDGLDEANSPGPIIRLLADLQFSNVPVRIVLVSRKTHEISEALQKVEKCILVNTICIEGNHDDLRSHIEQEMNLAGLDDYRHEVTAQILDRSKDNFLWVHLAVQKVNTCHTKLAVEHALRDLPPGMEALYNRMVTTIVAQTATNDGKAGKIILSWAVSAQRLLSVGELTDALGSIGLLDIQRAINDLCGGFVIINTDGMVTLIHETAREFLTAGGYDDRPIIIDETLANDMVFKSCLLCLTSPKTRLLVKRNQPVVFLDYAINYWFIHFSHGTVTEPDIIDMVIQFLQILVTASRCLSEVALKLRNVKTLSSTNPHFIKLVEDWAIDLINITGKYGNILIKHSEAIHKLIPELCPVNSVICQQFGLKELKLLQVSGFTNNAWDDCLARFSFEQNVKASSILAVGASIVVLTILRTSSHIIIYNSTIFEEQHRIHHPERVISIQTNKPGNLLITYGYTTTRIWDMTTGYCIKVILNPSKLPKPHIIQFVENDEAILVGDERRCFRHIYLHDDKPQWNIAAKILEETFEDYIVNYPICSALSPDETMVAFSYRRRPVTVWQLNPPIFLGQCRTARNKSDSFIDDYEYGAVFHLIWHPSNEEVFGLDQIGLLFKWDPCEEVASRKVSSSADRFTINNEGSLVATGNYMGIIKILTTSELSLLYQFSSQDPVLNLAFSADSRRIYDIRGNYGNVWESNVLVQLGGKPQSPEHSSEDMNETGSHTQQPLRIGRQSVRNDDVRRIAGQSVGSLYCYGTAHGVSVLCEAGNGKICTLTRSKSYERIEQMTWSKDGKLVAIADSSGVISIKAIEKASNLLIGWQVNRMLDVSIDLEPGHITGLLLCPNNQKIVLSTTKALFFVVLGSKEILKRSLPPTESNKLWTCHPTLPDYLLGFGTSAVHVYSWTTLEEFAVYIYSPAQDANTETIADHVLHKSGTIPKCIKAVKKLMLNANSPYILLSTSDTATSDQFETHNFLFAVTDLHLRIDRHNELPFIILPAELAKCIREPLALLPGGCFAFLDVDRWVCTISLTALNAGWLQEAQESELRKEAIKRYYFLPSDWATAKEVNLCTITPNGTLLCPKNGEVGAVQSTELRKQLSYYKT